MSTPQITALPTSPSRNMAPDVFIAAADAFIAALPLFVTQANALAVFAVNTDITQAQSAAAYAASAEISRTLSQAAQVISSAQAAAAAASAETARAIVGIPPAYTSLITQPNKITSDMTIPDGNNAVIFGDFEVSPDVTVTGLGNANFVGLG
jgi:hypothetical protein